MTHGKALRRAITALPVYAVCSGLLMTAEQSAGAAERQIDAGYSHQTAYLCADEDLNRLQDLFRRALEATRTEFRGQTGLVKAFRPGASYPQVWLRDAATHIPITRYCFPSEYLNSWLEEHLCYQAEDGRLYDWIGPGKPADYADGAPKVKEVYESKEPSTGKEVRISADKNTTCADQEASGVDAGYQIFKITGDRNWLAKTIKGKALLERLDDSLEYLLKHRFDPRYGLITSAFTTDFGDVTPLHADQLAIYLDEKTPLVASSYTNSFFYRAAEDLRKMYQILGRNSRADYWEKQARMIKDNMNRRLWQEGRGFYRNHLVLTPDLAKGWQDDSNIFSLAGNALAVLYGVADDRQAREIFEVAEELQHKLGVSTIAGILLPPYPRGFFKHPLVRDEYRYLNGGQWDWFAGRLLLAEFEKGYSQRAYRQLVEIAKKNVENDGLHEWDTREGEGRGSPNYAGNAGALAGAVFQGLFGIHLSADALRIEIRLSDSPGRVHVFQPATGTYIAYQYGYDKAALAIRVRYESNFSRPGMIKILLPPGRQPIGLWLDGKEKSFSRETIGEDTFVSLFTDWKQHQLRLKLR